MPPPPRPPPPRPPPPPLWVPPLLVPPLWVPPLLVPPLWVPPLLLPPVPSSAGVLLQAPAERLAATNKPHTIQDAFFILVLLRASGRDRPPFPQHEGTTHSVTALLKRPTAALAPLTSQSLRSNRSPVSGHSIDHRGRLLGPNVSLSIAPAPRACRLEHGAMDRWAGPRRVSTR